MLQRVEVKAAAHAKGWMNQGNWSPSWWNLQVNRIHVVQEFEARAHAHEVMSNFQGRGRSYWWWSPLLRSHNNLASLSWTVATIVVFDVHCWVIVEVWNVLQTLKGCKSCHCCNHAHCNCRGHNRMKATVNGRNAHTSGIGRNGHWSSMSKAESKELSHVVIVGKSVKWSGSRCWRESHTGQCCDSHAMSWAAISPIQETRGRRRTSVIVVHPQTGT